MKPVRLLAAVGCILLAATGCTTAVDQDLGAGEISPGNSVVVLTGMIVADDGRLISVVPQEVTYHLSERFTPGTGQVEKYPIPEVGVPMTALSMEELDLPRAEPLVLFFSYLPRSTQDWEWRLKLALHPTDQRPVDGLSDLALEQLDRLILAGEDPTRDTVSALIELVEEGAAASSSYALGRTPVAGPRTLAFHSDPNLPTAAERDDAELAAFISASPTDRQLPDMVDDIIYQSADALGVTWVFQEIALVYDPETSPYFAVGIFVPGVGVGGPFILGDDPVIPIDTYIAAGRGFDVIAWRESPASIRTADTAELLGVVHATSLSAGSDTPVALLVDIREPLTVEAMEPHELSELVSRILSDKYGDPTHRSELDENK